MSGSPQWISEKWSEVEVRYSIRRILYELKTAFQHLLLVDTHAYGKMLLLDGIVQTSEEDEFIYHEMMTHVPLLSHPDPQEVLIIGGGDGGALREVLRYASVEKATLVEIDPMVIDFCREHLPTICQGAFDDSRTELIIADGARYVENAERRFDVVIVDSPDPIGPAQFLFSEKFYNDIHKVLKPNGIMVRQTGSIHTQSDEQKQAYKILRPMFNHVAFYVYSVPTYVGGFFSSVFCSDTIDPRSADEGKIREIYRGRTLETEYYTPGIHVGAFHIPPFMEKKIC